MNIIRSVSAAAWWLALIIWLAAIATPAAAAMVAFTRLPELQVAIPASEAYFDGDSAAAGRFVAGYVTNPIFVASDSIRLGAAILACIAMAATGARPTGRGRWIRIATSCVAIATAILVATLALISSPLAESLEAWRIAVLANDPIAADAAKSLFDPLHVRASRLMQAELVLLLIAAVASGAASASPPAIADEGSRS